MTRAVNAPERHRGYVCAGKVRTGVSGPALSRWAACKRVQTASMQPSQDEGLGGPSGTS